MGPRRWGAQNLALFLPSPATVSLFFCLSGGLLVEFWWCLKYRGLEMCTFGVPLSCASGLVGPAGFHVGARMAAGFIQQPEDSKRAHLRVSVSKKQRSREGRSGPGKGGPVLGRAVPGRAVLGAPNMEPTHTTHTQTQVEVGLAKVGHDPSWSNLILPIRFADRSWCQVCVYGCNCMWCCPFTHPFVPE